MESRTSANPDAAVTVSESRRESAVNLDGPQGDLASGSNNIGAHSGSAQANGIMSGGSGVTTASAFWVKAAPVTLVSAPVHAL